MRKFLNICICLLLASPILKASAESYCAAIRGNGEGMPAHWGAMSAVIEKKGMPSAMAGGSSASITIFLLESLALNSYARSNSEKALMVKSFQGYFEALSQTPEGKALAALLGDRELFEALKRMSKKLAELEVSPQVLALLQRHLGSIEVLLNSKEFSGLINPEFHHYVKETIAFTHALAARKPGITEGQVSYRKNQISAAINNFGKFNVQGDETLFFRPGLISFRHLARVLGQMGDFYAGVELKNFNTQLKVKQDIAQFLKLCTPGTQGLSWREINSQKPLCRQLLGRAVLRFRQGMKEEGNQGVRIWEKIGSRLPVFPATSVLTGSAVSLYKSAREKYRFTEDERFGSNFQIDQQDLRFGYWGNSQSLNRIGANLRYDSVTRADEKSKKFIALGSQSWFEALATSPAEPGLSNLVDLNQNIISAGGWSDLHPTLVLRAYGCQDIVYLTRRGGESLFAQGVMKKLTNIEGFHWGDWSRLSAQQRSQKNAWGDSRDTGAYASLWSRLYNMANPQSSIRKSMMAATTVVCSNWDSFDSKKEMNALIEDAFRAPWLTNPRDICR
jgi:hypothetical protein